MFTESVFKMSSLINILTILVGCVAVAESAKRLSFVPDEISVWSDNEILNFTYMIDNSAPSINLTFTTFRDIEDVDIHVEGAVRTKDDLRHYAMFNSTYSLCRILSVRNASPLAIIIFNRLSSYGHIPHNCPIKKDTYRIRKSWAPPENLPSAVPEIVFEGKSEAYAIFGDETVMIFNSSVKGHAVYKEIDNANIGFLPLLGGRK